MSAMTKQTETPNGFAIACILGSCFSLQFGASLAIQLFPHIGTWATSSARLCIAALILLALTRPKVWRFSREQWLAVGALGLSMGAMNGFFYAGIERVPLGPAVTIEFLGPLLLAAILSRSLHDATSVALALIGMLLLGFESLTGDPLDPLGVGALLVAGFFWAMYILANKRAGALVPGQGGLAVALAIGGLATLPFGWEGTCVLVTSPDLLLIAVGTSVLASLIPYSLELIAMRRLRPQVFSIFISFEPAFAALIGWVVLAQTPSPLKLVAITLVIAASVNQTLAGHSRGLLRGRRSYLPLRLARRKHNAQRNNAAGHHRAGGGSPAKIES